MEDGIVTGDKLEEVVYVIRIRKLDRIFKKNVYELYPITKWDMANYYGERTDLLYKKGHERWKEMSDADKPHRNDTLLEYTIVNTVLRQNIRGFAQSGVFDFCTYDAEVFYIGDRLTPIKVMTYDMDEIKPILDRDYNPIKRTKDYKTNEVWEWICQ